MENCRYTIHLIWKRLRLFRIFVSANQLNLYGAVAEMCEEYETPHERTGRPVVMGQTSSSLVLSAIETEVPSDCDDPALIFSPLHLFEERIEKLSQQDKLSEFCMDEGFLSVVENGQYFMTKDTGDLTHFNTVACREHSLPKEEAASQPKGWIQGTPKLGPYWKLQPVICTVNMELKQRQHSLLGQDFWKGTNKFVMNLNNNETEIPEDQLEEYDLKIECKRFCMPIEGSRKTTKKNLPALSRVQFLLGKELGPVLNWRNNHSPILKYRRSWFIFFVMDNMWKRCNGLRKWSWVIQWMIWDLSHLLVVFQCRILKYLMRGLLQHWFQSSIILSSKKSAWGNKRPRSRTVSFAEDRLLTWSTITSG